MTHEPLTIECGTHGRRTATFMCQHLLEGEKRGFNIGYDEDEADFPYPDAWCDDCEKVLQECGEWNDESQSFANIKAVCSECYTENRARNWLANDEAWSALINSACSSLFEKQEKFLSVFDIGEHGRWERDQQSGILTFFQGNIPVVEAKFHFAGSLSLESNSWMWAWANRSFHENSRSESLKVRWLGEEKKMLPLVAHLVDATEDDASHFSALMCEELEAIGTYRTLEKGLWTYMVITEAKHLQKKKLFGLFG